MSFMQPQIQETAYWEIETANGCEHIPTDVFDWQQPLADFADDPNEAFVAHVAPYLDCSIIHGAERYEGYMWRLSAPGYMDCTEWTPAETVAQAVDDLLGMHGDGLDVEDLREIGSWLDGFDDFWRGYLFGLAFTARNEDGEPTYGRPGMDIRETVLPEEIEESLGDDLVELLNDCLSFFTSAIDYGIDAAFERAGSDFHLTRNRHGAGYWDGGWTHGDKLTELAHPYGPAELMGGSIVH